MKDSHTSAKGLLLNVVLIIFGLLYIALVLAFNSSLIDIVVSVSPNQGIAKLDSTSRAISSIAFGLPITLFLIKRLRILKIFGNGMAGVIGTIIFIAAGSLITSGQRQIAHYFVEGTTPDQRIMALGAIIGTHALAVGSLSMPQLGLDTIDLANPSSKVAAVFFIPYMALTGQAKKILDNAGTLMERSAVRNNQIARPLIEDNLEKLCQEASSTHTKYLSKSKDIQSGIGQSIKKDYYLKYLDKALGYQGTLPLGLDYKTFIAHQDIQYTIRSKFVDAIDASSTSAQFDYIFPKAEQKTSLVTLFDRKLIDPCIKWPEFMREYGAPTGRHFSQKIDRVIQQRSWDDLPRQDEFNSIGEKAVYGLIVPSMGMIWTLIAFVIAMTTLVYRSTKLMISNMVGASIAGILTISLLVFIPFNQQNFYMDLPDVQEGFSYIENGYGILGKPIAIGLEWSIRMAPLLYPIGYFARNTFVGFFFGLDTI